MKKYKYFLLQGFLYKYYFKECIESSDYVQSKINNDFIEWLCDSDYTHVYHHVYIYKFDRWKAWGNPFFEDQDKINEISSIEAFDWINKNK